MLESVFFATMAIGVQSLCIPELVRQQHVDLVMQSFSVIPNCEGNTSLSEKYPLRDAMIEYDNLSLEILLNEEVCYAEAYPAMSDGDTSNKRSQTFKQQGKNVSVKGPIPNHA